MHLHNTAGLVVWHLPVFSYHTQVSNCHWNSMWSATFFQLILHGHCLRV